MKKAPKDYPDKTSGSDLAARGRVKANKMTPAQREKYFRRGMFLAYGPPDDKVLGPASRRNAIADEF